MRERGSLLAGSEVVGRLSIETGSGPKPHAPSPELCLLR